MEMNRLIETIAAHAWPAEVVEEYGSWLLRANRGVTKRANSVLMVGAIPTSNWLTEIEAFYKEKNIPACFYITESTPQQADVQLQEANYEKTTELAIMAIQTNMLISHVIENPELHVVILDQVTTEWIDAFIRLEGHDEKNRSAFTTIFEGIRLAKGFLAIYLQDEIVAVATIAAESAWGYISNVVVSEQHRRKGIASQLLLHLAEWAHKHDTENLFMQVLTNNEPALQLYEKLGFKRLAKSYYRMKK